jgi:hypothetical protein
VKILKVRVKTMRSPARTAIRFFGKPVDPRIQLMSAWAHEFLVLARMFRRAPFLFDLSKLQPTALSTRLHRPFRTADRRLTLWRHPIPARLIRPEINEVSVVGSGT